MFDTMRIDRLREGQTFLYSGAYQVVVKAERNIFGAYDVWYKPVEFKNVSCPATGHFETNGDHAVMIPARSII
jgi:hypothetical protein